jgi:hypothetical protein
MLKGEKKSPPITKIIVAVVYQELQKAGFNPDRENVEDYLRTMEDEGIEWIHLTPAEFIADMKELFSI